MEHNAINLSQGYPDFPAPEVLKKAAADAIFADVNQYAITWGAKSFRDALVYKTKKFLGIDIDPEREITVSCGSTEAMIDVLLAVINPGDEVIVFEPFYENYGPTIISGATPCFAQLRRPDWPLTRRNWRPRSTTTRPSLLMPNNPTGRFSREELKSSRSSARNGMRWLLPTILMNNLFMTAPNISRRLRLMACASVRR